MTVDVPWDQIAWLVTAGAPGCERRITSLIDPGSTVHVALDGLAGLDDVSLGSALRERGVVFGPHDEVDMWVCHPDFLESGLHSRGRHRPSRVVLVASSPTHGSRRGSGTRAPSHGQVTGRLIEIAARAGLPSLRGRQHCIRPYDRPTGATRREYASLQSDPSTYVEAIAMRFDADTVDGPNPLVPTRPPERTVLFLANEAPALWQPNHRRAVLSVLHSCQARGQTPVLSWAKQRLSSSLETYRDYTRVGIVIHGGDGVFDDAEFGAHVARPPVGALLGAYDPEAVVVLDAERVDEELQLGILAHPGSHVLAVEGRDSTHANLVDAFVELTQVVEALDQVLGARDDPATPQIPVIESRSRVAGLTSVVIPVHGALPLTLACLDSLQQNTARPLELIVVDNASPDITRSVLRGRSDIKLIELDRNTGFAAGSNSGLAEAMGEWVCCLNNDTEVVAGWLDALIDVFSQHPTTGLAGPRSNSISGRQVIPNGPPAPSREAHAWGADWARSHRGRTWLTNRLVGFCLLARGNDLERLGGFDEGVGIGNFEDDDLGHRFRAGGQVLRVADGSVVLHHGSATFRSMGISWVDAMKAGARHAGSRWPMTSDLATGVVVGDGEPVRSAQTAADLLAVCDVVVIAEQGDVLPTKLAAAQLSSRAVSVRPTMTDDLVPVGSPWALVATAGTRLAVADWGGARARLEELSRTSWLIAGTEGQAWVVPAPAGGVSLRPDGMWQETQILQ